MLGQHDDPGGMTEIEQLDDRIQGVLDVVCPARRLLVLDEVPGREGCFEKQSPHQTLQPVV